MARPLCTEAGGVSSALAAVQQRLEAAAGGRSPLPRLVAVSKTKPNELLQEAYEAGVRDFGENYVQELVGKAPALPPDIRWRFIGKLQSNKAKALVAIPNLVAVETVDSLKLALKIEAAVASADPPRAAPLDVLLQVDSSPWEGTKNGMPAAEVPDVAAAVRADCPHLRLAGLMTIGAPGDASCFQALVDCREAVAARLGLEPATLELSMGMSGDFEAAVKAGSTSVRVGSSIFGERDYSAKG
jgi:hypothetical protein